MLQGPCRLKKRIRFVSQMTGSHWRVWGRVWSQRLKENQFLTLWICPRACCALWSRKSLALSAPGARSAWRCEKGRRHLQVRLLVRCRARTWHSLYTPCHVERPDQQSTHCLSNEQINSENDPTSWLGGYGEKAKPFAEVVQSHLNTQRWKQDLRKGWTAVFDFWFLMPVFSSLCRQPWRRSSIQEGRRVLEPVRRHPMLPCLLKIALFSRALVAHACNPTCSGGRDQEDRGSKPPRANSSRASILKISITKKKKKKGWWSGSRCRSWVQTPAPKKK
jgi:hypothetical protein